ncbi:MAG: sigma-70 family RNA polymerase sigma factor [Lysobacterales bacterium]
MARGDATALAELMQRHTRRLHQAASTLLGDPVEAEDACQEAFLQAWRLAADWQGGRARFSTWLHQVALNGCRDRLRRRRPQVEIDDQLPGDAALHPERWVARGQREAALQQALAELPERQREAIALFHHAGMAQSAAADAMGVSVDALESLLARGRRQLRQTLMAGEAHPVETDRRAGGTG